MSEMDSPPRITPRRSFLRTTGFATGSVFLPSVGWSNSQPERPLGVALVGLGSYANSKLRPALRQTQFCRLAGVVTGSASKGAAWAHHYNFSPSSVYHYDVRPGVSHVDFSAHFNEDGNAGVMHEKSEFELIEGNWIFTKTLREGPAPAKAAPKIGRNEPCPCGSGKKYKKCCGR